MASNANAETAARDPNDIPSLLAVDDTTQDKTTKLMTVTRDGKNYLLVDTELTLDGDLHIDNIELTSPGDLGDGSKNVTTAGTAETIAASTACASVIVQAKTSNTGAIYVGASTVDNTRGVKLLPGDSVPIDIDNLADVYIDADTNGEGITFTYSV